MSTSPSGNLLASIDMSGNLSMWELPSFRLKRKWTPQELVSGVHNIRHNIFIIDHETMSFSLHTAASS